MLNSKKNVQPKSVSGNGKKPIVSSNGLKGYHVETITESGCFNFFTEAKNHKQALRNLEVRSWDFKKLVKAEKNMTITVKLIY